MNSSLIPCLEKQYFRLSVLNLFPNIVTRCPLVLEVWGGELFVPFNFVYNFINFFIISPQLPFFLDWRAPDSPDFSHKERCSIPFGCPLLYLFQLCNTFFEIQEPELYIVFQMQAHHCSVLYITILFALFSVIMPAVFLMSPQVSKFKPGGRFYPKCGIVWWGKLQGASSSKLPSHPRSSMYLES